MEDARLREDPQVMGHGRLAKIEPIGQVTHTRLATLAGRDQADETQPGRIRDDAKRLRQPICFGFGKRRADKRGTARLIDLLDEPHRPHIDSCRCIRQRIDRHRWKGVSREVRRSVLSAGLLPAGLLLSGSEATGGIGLRSLHEDRGRP